MGACRTSLGRFATTAADRGLVRANMRRCAQCCLDPPIARVSGRSIPRCTRNQGARARGHGPMDHYALCTSRNRYPRLFEPGSVPLQRLQPILWCGNGPNRTDCSAWNRISAYGSDSKVVDDRFAVPWGRVALHLVESQPSPQIEGWFGPT